jgi:hypothetical protein
MASPDAIGFWPFARQLTTPRLVNRMGLIFLLLARNIGFASRTFASLVTIAFAFTPKGTPVQKGSALRTPAGFSQALIKIYSLVDCPIYSVVKYRPHQLALDHPASASMDFPNLGVCNPQIAPTQCSAPSELSQTVN